MANATTATNNSTMALNKNNNNNSTLMASVNEEVTSKEDPCAVATPYIRLQTNSNNQTSSTNETSKYFDIEYACKTFEDSMADKNAILLHHYLNGFKELMK